MRALFATLLLCLTSGLITVADAHSGHQPHHHLTEAAKPGAVLWHDGWPRADFSSAPPTMSKAGWPLESHSARSARPAHTTGYGTTRPADCYGIPWCGCWLKHALGSALSAADKALNLNQAIEWAHVGLPASPHVGAIVVWRHHVGTITGQASGGAWIVTSGNDGHAVRTRPRSIAGAIAIRDTGV